MTRRWPLFLLSIVCAAAQIPENSGRDAELTGIFKTAAAQPPARHRGPVMRQLESLILQQARYLVSELKPWGRDPRAALLPLQSKTASSENGIRPGAHTAKGLALLVRLAPDEVFPPAFPRTLARDRALALLRYLLRTHGASGEACADGKPWRDQWQSAYWAAMTGEAAWLLWDDLAPDERWLAGRMICDEADRFVGVTPPINLVTDTKAEENAWNSAVVSLAFNMFPRHPHHAAWQETSIRWIASSFATQGDAARTDLVDGKPLKEWVAGANLYDDFTLENHSRVHPDYMACTYLLTSQLPMYAWGGNAPPAALNLNVEAIVAIIKRLATPEGSVIYPNGQDWGLHRNVDWLEYYAMAAVVYHDRQAATLMRRSLDTVLRMAARRPNGPVYLPEETKLASDQHMVLEYAAHVYALMAQLGEGPEPVPDTQLWRELSGSHIFPSGKFGVMRTKDSIATFSWGAQVMGSVLPLRDDLLLTPEGRGLIGYVGLEGVRAEVPLTTQVAVASLAAGFGVSGVISRGGGIVEQRFGFLALPDGRAIYVDVATLTGTTRPSHLDLGTLGVLNDPHWPLHDGSRTLAHQDGTRVFTATGARSEAPADFASPWFNLDGLGIACVDVSGHARYVPSPTSAAGRLEQRFHLNTIPAVAIATAKPGEPLAHSVLVFYPNQSAAQTKTAAARCQLLSARGEKIVRLRLDDGTVATFDLTTLQLSPSFAPPPPRHDPASP